MVYEDGTTALTDVDLEVGDGELLVLVGPSGCGKSTLLRVIAGLEAPTSGTVTIGERVVTRLEPRERDVAMVFQNYALYPSMSVYDNLAFTLRIRKVSKGDIDRKVREVAETLGLTDELLRKPRALSGGQRQRVAMGRAMMRNPQAFLMDEPLSNLDAQLRVHMRSEIARLQRRLGVTTVYVTHDQTEAMTMGDRVAVLRNGGVLQVDTPQALYDRPVDVFVARFIGSPAMNVVGAMLTQRDGGAFAEFGEHRLRIDDALRTQPSLRALLGRPALMGIRPEAMQDARLMAEASEDRCLRTTVRLREAMGPEVYVHFDIPVPPVAGQAPGMLVDSNAFTEFVARFDPRTGATEGQSVDVWVDTTQLYFFDPENGQAATNVRPASMRGAVT
jgi:multiple sugar transport system ATP-binding protein